MAINNEIKMVKYVMLLIFAIAIYICPANIDYKSEFKKLSFSANKMIAVELLKEINADTNKAVSASTCEELKKSLPKLNKKIVDKIESLGKSKINLLLANTTIELYTKTLESFISELKNIDALNKTEVARKKTKEKVVEKLDLLKAKHLFDLKTLIQANNKSELDSIKLSNSSKIYLDSLHKLLPAASFEKIAMIVEWWDYMFWGIILFMLLVSILLFLSFIKRSETSQQEALFYRGDSGLHNNILPSSGNINYISHSELNKKIEEIKIQFEKSIEDKFRALSVEIPAVQSVPIIEEKKIEEIYFESPEQGGYFLLKHKKNTISSNTLYVVKYNRKRNTIEFDLLDSGMVGYRSAMDSSSTILKPACNYKEEPKLENKKIVKSDSSVGVLIDLGNGQLQIETKINIKFI
jgi:hypothetical protein